MRSDRRSFLRRTHDVTHCILESRFATSNRLFIPGGNPAVRNYMTMVPVRLALLTALATAFTPPLVLAQSVATAPKTRTWTDPRVATLMLVDDLGSSDARAVVIRRPGEMPNNIILVTR